MAVAVSSSRQQNDRRDVIVNTVIDVSLFVLVLAVAGSEFWAAHIVRIIFVIRIADYSSLRQGSRWSIFQVNLPRVPSELDVDRDLTLFSAYRILRRVWFFAGVVLIACCVWTPLLDRQILQNNLGRIATIVWALLILNCHLPKRLLLWRGQRPSGFLGGRQACTLP